MLDLVFPKFVKSRFVNSNRLDKIASNINFAYIMDFALTFGSAFILSFISNFALVFTLAASLGNLIANNI